MHRNLTMTLAAALMLGSAATQANESVRLFDYPGAQRTGFNDINDRGIALGSAIVGLDPYPYLLNLRTGELTNLTPVPGNFLTLHDAINNDGIIVGELFDQDDNTAVAFIRQPDGTFTFFSHPNAHSITGANAINENGLVAGIRDKPAGGFAAFVYNTATGRFQNFDAGQSTEPHGINKWGKVVGRVIVLEKDDPCGGGPVGTEVLLYGFVKHQDGFITLFQVNGQQTSAGDITDDGLVIGSVYDPPATKSRIFTARIPRERCVFVNVPRRKLIGVPGTEYVVGGINNFGRIVGVALEPSGDETTLHGFITTLRR